MSNVLRREACPSCREQGLDKKGNNRIIYVDESGYCFRCDVYFKPANQRPNNLMKLVKPKSKMISGIYDELKDRLITIDTCKFFKYQVTIEEENRKHIANYFDSIGNTKRQKIRTQDKQFYNLGDTTYMGFFGKNLWKPNDNTYVVITEGEIDAMTIAQVFGCKYPVVSIPDGANSVKRAIAANLEWLLEFKYIVLAFDNDDAGRKATEDALQELSEKMVHVVNWPEGIKDANQLLTEGRKSEIKRCVSSASPVIPEFLVDLGKIAKDSLRPKKIGYSWGIPTLDMLTYGIRPKELILVGAGSSIGKTTFLNQIALNLVFEHDKKIGIISFEQSPNEIIERLTGLMIKARVWVPGVQYDRDEAVKLGESLTSKAFAIDTSKGINTIDKLVNKVTYMVRALGINYIFLDHLTAIASMMKGDERKGIDTTMYTFARMVKDLDCTIFLASHLSKPELSGREGSNSSKTFEEGRRPLSTDLRGSQSVQYYPTSIITLSRNIYEVNSVMILELMKNRIDSDKVGSKIELVFSKQTGKLEENRQTI